MVLATLFALTLVGLFMVGAAIIGAPRSFHHRYRFVVQIDGFASAGFRDCSPIKGNVAVIEHWEGGKLVAYKEAGRYTCDNITLTRGATSDLDLYNLFKRAARAFADVGHVNPEYKVNFDLVQYDRDASELRRWSLHQAFATSFTGGSWDNTVDEVVIEEVELALDYFTLPDQDGG